MVIGLFDCGGGPVACSDWLSVSGSVVVRTGGVRITYIGRAQTESSSLDAAPVTGSLVFSTSVYCLAVYTVLLDFTRGCYLAVRIVSGLLDVDYFSGKSGLQYGDRWCGSGGWPGWHQFGVELYVPWDAPEPVVNLQSEGVLNLGSIPDVIGLAGRRPGAAVCRVLQGRDIRSVRVLIPDSRGLKQDFHNVTIVDMGVLPESSVSMQKYPHSASNDHLRSSVIWCGYSRTWR